MAADGKWIDGLKADRPIRDAARITFAARFRTVDQTWAAALEPTTDPEPVHDFRVATRRAAAALRAFGDLLPHKVCRKLTKRLRNLRRAAGNARDGDVFLIELQKWAATRPDKEQPGLDWLAGLAWTRRDLALRSLRDTKDERSKWNQLIREAEPRSGDATLADRAVAETRRRLSTFEAAAGMDLDAPQNLHQLRIAGKRLRYTLELFVDGLGEEVRTRLYPEIEAVQDILGDAHDARVIADRVTEDLAAADAFPEALRQRYRLGIVTWKNHLEGEAAAGPARFQTWYQNWREAIASVRLTPG